MDGSVDMFIYSLDVSFYPASSHASVIPNPDIALILSDCRVVSAYGSATLAYPELFLNDVSGIAKLAYCLLKIEFFPCRNMKLVPTVSQMLYRLVWTGFNLELVLLIQVVVLHGRLISEERMIQLSTHSLDSESGSTPIYAEEAFVSVMGKD
ncbi:hypothetical protein Taro_047350 [Colocasia esculenta]|uniref:Uncharacterized protein n=1 Tax=Colocasia esculenta TaxID=4460 RepID=A0A843X0T7_COLES|nr:hypothetical protein [Colocasia esculenta]